MNDTSTISRIVVRGKEAGSYLKQLALQLEQDPARRHPVRAWINQFDGLLLTLDDGEIIHLPGLKARQGEAASRALARDLWCLGFGGRDVEGLVKMIRNSRRTLDLRKTDPMRRA